MTVVKDATPTEAGSPGCTAREACMRMALHRYSMNRYIPGVLARYDKPSGISPIASLGKLAE